MQAKDKLEIKGFSDKVANGIAPFLIGVFGDIGGFDGKLPVGAQSVGANNMIFTLYALVPAIIGLIGFATMFLRKMYKGIKEMEAIAKAR